ncbi:hypothetical protein ACH5RR_023084 [Cinchona calisaya]|uniref:Transmembrane protein n=1 Tax=Cinchona calisaya TaxID=153742 RepID=A0ABD2ZDJ9_9GENT
MERHTPTDDGGEEERVKWFQLYEQNDVGVMVMVMEYLGRSVGSFESEWKSPTHPCANTCFVWMMPMLFTNTMLFSLFYSMDVLSQFVCGFDGFTFIVSAMLLVNANCPFL